ncbi:MAG: hypothetical protein E7315_01665 [Clostridiales bacterium]|nr:hypothetical protein [Clostridiales bacterium]
MNINIYYGASGVGKSHYIHSVISKTDRKTENAIFVVVPEQYTHITELSLINELNSKGLFDITVTSFKRLCHLVRQNVAGRTLPVLTDQGRELIVNRIINTCDIEDSLKAFSVSACLNAYTDIARLIAQFKRNGISPEDITSLSKGLPEYIRDKLSDISIIYSLYNEFIFNSGSSHRNVLDGIYIDPEDETSLLEYSILAPDSQFKNAYFFFDGFDTFSKKEIEIITSLCKISQETHIVMPYDRFSVPLRKSLFYEQINMDNSLRDALNEAGLCFTEYRLIPEGAHDTSPATVKAVELKSYKSKDLTAFEHIIFSDNTRHASEDDITGLPSFEIFSTPDVISEAERVADTIYRYVKSNDWRYRDIVVVCPDIGAYKDPLRRTFSKRRIPYFIDSKRSVSSNVIVRYLKYMISVFAHGMTYSNVFGILKTGLTSIKYTLPSSPDTEHTIGDNEISFLQKYCASYKITDEMWSKPFFIGASFNNLELINSLREAIYAFFDPVISVFPKKATAKEYTELIFRHVFTDSLLSNIDLWLKSILDAKEIYYHSENTHVLTVIKDTLEQISDFEGDIEFTISQYSELINTSFDNAQVSLIPPSTDEVLICDAMRLMAQPVKALFIMGTGSDKYLPTSPQSLFDPDECTLMRDASLSIGADTRQITARTKYNAYCLLSKPTCALAVSTNSQCPFSDNPDPLISQLSRMYSYAYPDEKRSLITLLRENVFLKRGYVEENEASLFNLVFSDYSSTLPRNVVKKIRRDFENDPQYSKDVSLYNSMQRLSFSSLQDVDFPTSTPLMNYTDSNTFSLDISRVEKYNKCPFSYFIRYGIHLYDRDIKDNVSAGEIGSFVHSVIDSFTQHLATMHSTPLSKVDNSITDSLSNEADIEYCRKITDEWLEKNYEGLSSQYSKQRFLDTDANKYTLTRIRTLMESVLSEICKHLYSFNPIEFHSESRFGTQKSVVLEKVPIPETDKYLSINGKIDRFDIILNDSKKYFTVVDYKTSGHKFEPAALKNGTDIQLITYSRALQNALTDSEFAGAYYCSIVDSVNENEDAPALSLNGIITAHADEAKLLSPIEAKLAVHDEDEIEELFAQEEYALQSAASGLYRGRITKSAKKAECDSCPYYHLCYNQIKPNGKEIKE